MTGPRLCGMGPAMKHSHTIDPAPVEDGECPLLFGRVLDGKGGARPIEWGEAQGWTPAAPGEVLWLHMHRACPGAQEWLESALAIPEPTAELLVSDQTRPRAFREGDTLVATLRDINFNPGYEPEDMISMQLWSDGARIVTLRRDPQQSVNEVRDLLDSGRGPRDAGAMITQIVELLIDHLNHAIVDMNAMLDDLEATGLEGDLEQRASAIAALRRDCLALQRHMSPQHEALEQIGRDAPEWFEPDDRREIVESIARLRRHLDDINISKESAVVLQDELRARSQAIGQEATYKLGVMAGIFLPLTFFTGLLGSNVAGIPYAGEPWAFWGVVALCALISAAILALFWRLRWL